jgi:hypothetical protein
MNKLVEKLITNIICTTFFIFILYMQELNWVQNNSILLDLMSFVSNVFLVILGNICKNITISNKSSKNINCMYSATLKIYTFDRNLKNFTL